MCFKNVAIISTSSIYTSLFFSLPTTIFTLYIFLISQTLVYPRSNFIIILGNIPLAYSWILISLFSLPYFMASISLALIRISRGSIRMVHLILLWSELSTSGHVMDYFLAFGLSALELVSSLSVMR